MIGHAVAQDLAISPLTVDLPSRLRNTSGRPTDRKGGWYGWKPSSSLNFTIRVVRA